ncbi:plant U-box 45 [Actinidia rufa]|uniref:RING-type E3 ubiquitin transferase n=1 Tax=Actinidia rufa TaxID=165716 RepID=A0A7J0DEZ0_9ERIC|nr:plant U-box 45 [Actinidia rufa]
MDIAEVEENLFAIGDAKLHGGMCKTLSAIYYKVLEIFPVLEAARPRSTTGIQALCSLHITLEKTKNILQHCSGCSKLYLAITGDSIVLKFEKARCSLEDSLRRVNDIIPQAIGSEISEILNEFEGIEFSLDPLEKQVGDDIIALLQQGRGFSGNCIDNNELESFHQAASRLGITSSRAALTERRALKKLIERARVEEDKRKEVQHLAPLTVQGSFEDVGPKGNGYTFERQLSKLSSFNFKPNFRRSDQIPIPPEELRCPISLQLMYDPVIIASGQTYERICIEKWFSDGHNTCPKTRQQLPHLSLTPNYCVKGLVASWCEQNGVSVPDGPPESLDLNYWRLVLSESESANSKSIASIGSCKMKGVKVVPLEESCIIEEAEGNSVEDVPAQEEDLEHNVLERYDEFLMILDNEEDLRKKCKVVEQIRHLLKDDEEARIYMGANGFVEVLLRFLECAVQRRHEMAQEIGAMALFNLAVNNNRNKELMLAAGVLPLLEEMVTKSNSHGSATALYLNLSCLDEAKPIIGTSEAVSFLIKVLEAETDPPCKLDALHASFNLSTHSSNISNLLSGGIINGLLSLVTGLGRLRMDRKMHSCPYKLSFNVSSDFMCNGNEKCSQMVLQEGRQRDPLPAQTCQMPESSDVDVPVLEPKPLDKSISKERWEELGVIGGGIRVFQYTKC